MSDMFNTDSENLVCDDSVSDVASSAAATNTVNLPDNEDIKLGSYSTTLATCAITTKLESLPLVEEAMDDAGVEVTPCNAPSSSSTSIPNTAAEMNDPNDSVSSLATNDTALELSLSLLQSSPPPHSYRHSRAYRHFKNPPQPHMCIRTTTETGDELFINVLSWTRIVIPQEPSDPIPLYGGMRVPPGSPRNPPLVFAVMANPEVLKDSGRHSKDPEERRAMVELMCDFVEAMNPGVKLVRNAVILKDRDISGELKDVWNAVQAQRDREREEQMMQQRQQQHYHNITTQQMFPKLSATSSIDELNSNDETYLSTNTPSEGQDSVSRETEMACGSADMESVNPMSDHSIGNGHRDNSHQSEEVCSTDQIDHSIPQTQESPDICQKSKNAECVSLMKTTPPVVDNNPQDIISKTAQKNIATCTPTVPSKKEKLGGFLPNGCIFPRFKNNKHKDKEKEKDLKGKDKEKTLLNALKKSKEKKVAPLEQTEKTTLDSDSKTQFEKNCINLESEVQKLDLNKIDSAGSNERAMFVKLKVSANSAGGSKRTFLYSRMENTPTVPLRERCQEVNNP